MRAAGEGAFAMDLTEFKASLRNEAPDEGLDAALQALWWDAKGDWRRAHRLAQSRKGEAGSWVHAYLHRVEGDEANAGGWYRRAGKEYPTVPPAAEWDDIAAQLLGREKGAP